MVWRAGIARRAEHQAGEVDGQEARAVQRVGGAEGQRDGGERGDRVQAGGRQPRLAQRERGGVADGEADRPAPIASWRTNSQREVDQAVVRVR